MFKFFLRNQEAHKVENIEYFKHLVSIAYKDGHLDKVEVYELCKISEKLGIGTSMVQDLMNDHDPHEILSLPKDNKDRFDQLYDVISIMVADEEIKDEEVEFSIKLAKRLGFKEDIVGELIRVIYYTIESGSPKDVTEERAKQILEM